MSSNVEKALSLGFSVMLLALAFSMFFSMHGDFEEYLSRGNRKIESESLAILKSHEIFKEIKGSEVLHQLAQVRLQTNLYELGSEYFDNIKFSQEAELYVNGVEASTIDLSDVGLEDLYSVRYEFNTSGKIKSIYYDLDRNNSGGN
ncbi:MAG: hypothetical protein GX957_13070 [Clostridiaceae bacterium]|nr:hypothetical protein [Clostridiaceae bacterium]